MNKEYRMIKEIVLETLAIYHCSLRYLYVDGRGIEVVFVDSNEKKRRFYIDSYEVPKDEPFFNNDPFLINVVKKQMPLYLETLFERKSEDK